jgi:hypothetical protein
MDFKRFEFLYKFKEEPFIGQNFGCIDDYFIPKLGFTKEKGGIGVLAFKIDESPVILYNIDENVMTMDIIKKRFHIYENGYVLVEYMGKEYMLTDYLHDIKLDDFIKYIKFREMNISSIGFRDTVLHEIRRSFVYMYIMGYSNISTDNIHIRFDDKGQLTPDGYDMAYPVIYSDFELTATPIISDEILNRWFNSKVYSITNKKVWLCDDKNKSPKELFDEYYQKMMEMIRNNNKNEKVLDLLKKLKLNKKVYDSIEKRLFKENL